MRILLANTPLMYTETLAPAIQRHAPSFEVSVSDPASLAGEAERSGPHTLVRDDDGTEVASPDSVVFWSSIVIEDHPEARTSMDGKVSVRRTA
jgi:hypothetical protein